MKGSKTELGFAQSFFGLARRMRRQKPRPQWTERLAGFANEEQERTSKDSELTLVENQAPKPPSIKDAVPVALRLEGPYFTTADPARYNTVVCIVAGTGVSGALAISGAFKEIERQSAAMIKVGGTYQRPVCSMGAPPPLVVSQEQGRAGSIMSVGNDRVWKRCIVIWSVREEHYIDLPEFQRMSSPSLLILFYLINIVNSNTKFQVRSPHPSHRQRSQTTLGRRLPRRDPEDG
jgi:hypothetical protein